MRLRSLGVVGVALLLLQLGAAGVQADPYPVADPPMPAAAPTSPRPAPEDVVGDGAAEPIPAHHADDSTGDISAIADRLFSLAGPRFAGLRVDEAHHRISAYWAGGIPDAAADYAATRPAGITIELDDQAPYTRIALKAAAERVTNSSLGRTAGISSVAARAFDHPGLHIHVLGDVPAPAVARAIARLADLPSEAIAYTPHSRLVPLSAPLAAGPS